jgi:Protein of unknown function (DUF2009)
MVVVMMVVVACTYSIILEFFLIALVGSLHHHVFVFAILTLVVVVFLLLYASVEFAHESSDGRLTSSWNWTSRLAKKSYYHAFMLSGFQGFDGDFR